METVVDLDEVARELAARGPAWAARGVQTTKRTWRDAAAEWPQPLLTDRAAVTDPESVGLAFIVDGTEVARLVARGLGRSRSGARRRCRPRGARVRGCG